MLQKGRPIDPEFLPDELLYYRISVDGPVGSRPEGVDIRLPEDSVNRGKYSEPTDVLYPNYFHLGVAQFCVDAVPGPRYFEGREYNLVPEHDPEKDNYAHSEIRAYRQGERVVHTGKIPKLIKAEFRQLLAEAMVICCAMPGSGLPSNLG